MSETMEITDVSQSPLLKILRSNPYGSVEGLSDEELADPRELERCVYRQQFKELFELPVRSNPFRTIALAVDEDGGVDFGAFATVDFERFNPGHNRMLYKVDILKERLKDKIIILEIVSERFDDPAKYIVLKYLKMGFIEFEHIADMDMLGFADLYFEIRRLQKEIGGLQEVSWQRKQRAIERFLAG